MGEIYLTGVGVAFAVGIAKFLGAAVGLLSVRTRNMKQVGMYYALMSGTYVAEKPSGWKFFGFTVYLLLLAPLGSWLSVGSALWGVLRWRSSRAAAPEELKRLQYRIAHMAMTKQQMIEWQEEVSKVLGVAGPVRTGDGDNDPLVFVLEPGEWQSELRMHPDKRTMEFWGRTPDYWSTFHSTYEYRFEGDKPFARLIDEHSEHLGKKERCVQDGAVLETEMRRRAEASAFGSASVNEEVARCYKNVEWHPIADPVVRFFVMSMHPSQFSHSVIVSLVRDEIRRTRMAAEKASAEAKKLNFEIDENDNGIDFRFHEGWTEEEQDAASAALQNAMKPLGTNFNEVHSFKKIRNDLLRIIGQSTDA